MMNKIDDSSVFTPLAIAVLTISNSRTVAEDASGDILVRKLQEAGHDLAAREIVRDDIALIRKQIELWTKTDPIQIILTTGGTGFTGYDVTIEALEPLFEKKMEGFSTIFHMISYQTVGTITLQSRATAGVIHGTFVFCLPGSPGACQDAWDHILKTQFDSRQRPSNFVALMPRLREHEAGDKRGKVG